SLIVPDAALKALGENPAAENAKAARLTTPNGTAQNAGKLAEQAAEFLVPGMGEEAATTDIAKALPKIAPAARIGYGALTAGALNKAQGGHFWTGAAGGAVGGTLGETLRAAAPSLAESALGIRKPDRAFGRDVGRAVLNETSGLSPAAVAESARGRLDELKPALEKAFATSPNTVSLLPARQVVGKAINTATQR